MPWRLVLLWLCIALLPLRGWAFGAMLAPQSPLHAGIEAAAAAASPCHGAAASGGGLQAAAHDGHHAAGSGAESAAVPAAGTCALCDICHGAAAFAQLDLERFAPMNPGAPPAWQPTSAGRLAVHELFRPPRT